VIFSERSGDVYRLEKCEQITALGFSTYQRIDDNITTAGSEAYPSELLAVKNHEHANIDGGRCKGNQRCATRKAQRRAIDYSE
jgi:hypothetical protein